MTSPASPDSRRNQARIGARKDKAGFSVTALFGGDGVGGGGKNLFQELTTWREELTERLTPGGSPDQKRGARTAESGA